MDSSAWPGPGMSGDRNEPGAVGGEYAGAEGSNAVEGGADQNYLYGGQAGHNGGGAGDGY